MHASIHPSVRHMFLHRRWIDGSILESIRIDRCRDRCVPQQGCLSQWSLTRDLSIHGQRSPFSHGRFLSLQACLNERHDGFGGRTFVIIVIDELYHGGVGAGAQTFYFEECKEPILGGLARFNSQMRFNGALNVFGSANHAGCGAAELNKVLSHLCSIEHGVEGGDFVDSCWSHVDNVGNLVHGGDGQPTAMLALGQVEERDNAGLFVIGGVFS